MSQNSEAMIHKKLVPYNKKNRYECSVKVDAKDIKDPRVKTGRGCEIITKKTVEQSRQNRI